MTPFYEHWKETDLTERRWGKCCLCGDNWVRWDMRFSNITGTPAVGDSLTGQSSGAKTTVAEINLQSGSYIAGTALGEFVVATPSGSFTDGETVAGPGYTFVCVFCADKRYGFPYPETVLVTYRGKTYCRPHFAAYARSYIVDREGIPDIKELT